MKWFIPLSLILVAARASAEPPISSQDFDLACAIVSAAEIATSSVDSRAHEAAMQLQFFYLGRLSARDDKTFWGAVVKGRIAEMRQRAKSEFLYGKCIDFTMEKLN